jgi:hypothetical protein
VVASGLTRAARPNEAAGPSCRPFVDSELRELETDLLFRVKLADREALLFTLIEHQSTVDPMMPLRLLRYMVRVWERWAREQPEPRPLPAIVPIVVAHADRPWNAPTSLIDLMDLATPVRAALAPHLVNFRFVLDDLSTKSAEELEGRRQASAMARLVFLYLRHARSVQELLALLPSWRALVREVGEGPHGHDDLVTIVVYTQAITGTSTGELGLLFQDELGSRRGEVMGAAERLAKELAPHWREEGREEGRAEGRVEGRVEGRADVLLRLLGRRFGPVMPEIEARVRAASPQELDVMVDRVLEAQTVEDVVSAPK